jgi:hypothetical protein
MMAEMKMYRVSGTVTISCYTDVEASSEAEACEIASERGMCMVSNPERHGESSGEVWFHSGELDGVPEVVGIED